MGAQLSKQEFLSAVLDLVSQKVPAQQKTGLVHFVHQFYEAQPLENLIKTPIEAHAQTIADLWKFYQNRPYGTPKIKVYFWRPEITGEISERIIIDIINDDMSFLVDSLTALLTRHGLVPHLLWHPILHVNRDTKGNFIAFENREVKGPAITDESFIHCEVIESAVSEATTILHQEIVSILQEVRLANQDWQAMTQRIDQAVEDLTYATQLGIIEDTEEIQQFLRWMQNDHFTFLGYCQYDIATKHGRLLRGPIAHSALGILKNQALQDLRTLFEGIDYDSATRRLMMRPSPFLINKASRISNVHRPVLMDAIGIKRFNHKGRPIGIHLFLGLFTSIAYDSSARDIPYLRQKIDAVLKEANLLPTWHDGKALIHVLDSLPRDELFQASVSELKEIGLEVLQLQQLHRLSLFVRPDSFKRFVSCLVYIPEDRFNSELVDKIGAILVDEFKGEMSSIKAQFGSLAVARVHYIIRVPTGLSHQYNVKLIEARLVDIARSWRDDLRIGLNESFGEWKSTHLFKRYRQAFSQGYQERFHGTEVIKDIQMCEQVYESQTIKARVYTTTAEETNSFKLKLFHPEGPLALSDILPTLENLDVHVLSEMPFKVSPENVPFPIWIHEFELIGLGGNAFNLIERGVMFLETLHQVHQQVIENDGFNRLVLRAGLSWREAELMRAYFRYLKQLNIPFSESTIQNALLNHPHISQKLIQLFKARFEPDSALTVDMLEHELSILLQEVDSSDDDRILRRYLNLIQSTLRTNFFQRALGAPYKPCISFKFDCAQLEEIPLPRPLYEIFVYAPKIEAVHLRGGKVARGGIRWSDRNDDFRTEILGLMKAQMVKNVVIVPVGSKGGFVVKSRLSPNASRDDILAEGIDCYQTMIRGMLDITDNWIDGKVIPPENTRRYDGDDPYLVVAADKGTATFSDYANHVSKEYGFWLDDAFASGGSAGYDHKKMGITARGAWESVKQHFRALGINVQQETIRVVGVGDMSGDVFGNGLLLSDKIKLVGAFNHLHIFLDPDPDPQHSFAERQRLFLLPRSSWKDYDPARMSAGGGVFERSLKTIVLSPQAQQLLGLEGTAFSPNTIIKALLTLDVDLIWFGGIGTFVKASTESHQDVGDRANDGIRVNGRDLRCRVVAEGANLAVTHLGRIEYSRKVKGRINTDAIDNSAGVDTSDHEVNIKILLRQLMAQNMLSLTERNNILEKMTDSIAELVLRDNYLQNLCINLSEWKSAAHLDADIRLIRLLEKKGKLNRVLEFLPDDSQLADYQAAQMGLSRPEIAVLMAYAKIYLFEEILNTDLPDEPWLETILLNYFPPLLRRKYPQAILTHPLRREIIATCIVNQMINRTGPSLIYELQETTGASLSDVLRAFLVVIHVFSFERLWEEIETYDFNINQEIQMGLYDDLLNILKRIVSWALRNMTYYGGFDFLAIKLSEGIDFFIRDLHECLDQQAEERLLSIIDSYCRLNIDHDFAERLALLTIAAASPDILLIADKTGLSIKEVATFYYLVASRFQINRLRSELQELVQPTHWGRLAINGLQEDLYIYHNELVIQVIQGTRLGAFSASLSVGALFEHWLKNHQATVEKYDALFAEAFSIPVREFAVYSLLLRTLKHIAHPC
jgi:glutamate dehydrogenase